MDEISWPCHSELDSIRKKVVGMSGGDAKDVRFVVSPYRICPLGAYIDHQGETVSAMTINKGILLGFVPSDDSQVLLSSGQFKGEVKFRTDEIQLPKFSNGSNNPIQVKNSSKSEEECNWGSYARGALYALQKRGNSLTKGIIGFICGSDGLDSSGLSSSAAVGIAYLMAFENANNLTISPTENIEYDRFEEWNIGSISHIAFKLRLFDLYELQAWTLTAPCSHCLDCPSSLTEIICSIKRITNMYSNYKHVLLRKTKEHKLIHPQNFLNGQKISMKNAYKILLALSGLKQALTTNPGYNRRVAECQEAARILLQASRKEGLEPLLCNVQPETYEAYKSSLEPNLVKRAEHYFSENRRVMQGLEAWASGNLKDFGKLISESGLSSIKNYESGCEPLIQLYEILLRAPGVFGARFSGAGFRGCCIAFVDADCALEAASFVKNEYSKLQPELASQIDQERAVIICDAGHCARIM